MTKRVEISGPLTDANQINDRVNRTVSPSKCIILPPVKQCIQRRPRDDSVGSLSFMQRVKAETPENEEDIRGIEPAVISPLVAQTLAITNGPDIVNHLIKIGLLVVY